MIDSRIISLSSLSLVFELNLTAKLSITLSMVSVFHKENLPLFIVSEKSSSAKLEAINSCSTFFAFTFSSLDKLVSVMDFK